MCFSFDRAGYLLHFVQAFSSCSRRGLLFIAVPWLLIAMASRCRATRAPGAKGCVGCGTQAPSLQHTGLVALQHVESFWTRDRTCVPCIGRQILNHWTTRGVPIFHCLKYLIPFSLAYRISTEKSADSLIKIQKSESESEIEVARL